MDCNGFRAVCECVDNLFVGVGTNENELSAHVQCLQWPPNTATPFPYVVDAPTAPALCGTPFFCILALGLLHVSCGTQASDQEEQYDNGKNTPPRYCETPYEQMSKTRNDRYHTNNSIHVQALTDLFCGGSTQWYHGLLCHASTNAIRPRAHFGVTTRLQSRTPAQCQQQRTAPHLTAPPPHRTAPHRTAPHRTAPHRTARESTPLPALSRRLPTGL